MCSCARRPIRGRRDCGAVADGLLALLEKSDGWVAYKAGECLAGVLGDPRAVEPLLRHLRAFDLSSPTEDEVEDWKTVAFALMCLEPPGSPASDELLKTLEERDFEDVEYAGKLLAAIGDQRAIEPLVKRLRSDPTGEGSYWVVSALGDLRTVEAVDALIAAIPPPTTSGRRTSPWPSRGLAIPARFPR
jgi:HEAT repeat protein